jgi:hypothetical protein
VNPWPSSVEPAEVDRLGWTLVHFCWQGAVVALGLAVVSGLLRRRSAEARYRAAGVALGLMAALPMATFWRLGPSPAAARPTPLELPASAPSGPGAPGEAGPGHEPVTRAAIPPAGSAAGPAGEALAAPVSPRGATGWFEPLLPWAVGLWLAGVMVLSVRLLGGWLAVQRWRHRLTRPAAGWSGVAARLCRHLGVRRRVRVLESALVPVPAVIGWLRPVVLLPASALTGLPPRQLEALLAHELAHVRRHDYLVNLLQSVVETLLFYHPAVWWVSGRLRAERENCCDDLAVACCGDRLLYARALAGMEELRGLPAGLAPAAAGRPLLARIRRTLGLTPPPDDPLAGWWAGALALALLAALAPGQLFRPGGLADTAVVPAGPAAEKQTAVKPAAAPRPPEPLAAEAATMARRGVAYLKGARRGGNWEDHDWRFSKGYGGGLTSLALLALLESGVPDHDPAVARGLDYLRQLAPRQTYVVALQTMALCRADPKKDQAAIRRNVGRLVESVVRDDQGRLIGWTYSGPGPTSGLADNSNTQYAVMALEAAAGAGVRIDEKLWREIQAHYLITQLPDGGWGYASSPSVQPSSVGMTAAGVCGLLITAKHLRQKPGQLQPHLADALGWLGDRFSAGAGTPVFHYQTLYGVARAGQLAGRRTLSGKQGSPRDWFREGAAYLAAHQEADGSWQTGTGPEGNRLITTSFALLFLAKGR